MGILGISLFHAQTNVTAAQPPSDDQSRIAQFNPGIAVAVAIATTVFSITFLLLLYVKHCKRGEPYVTNSRVYRYNSGRGRNSGVDRKVIESLPMFRFSSLIGRQKDGLECAVCLNRFAAEEVLRLLPKCKHAFHVECVDTWLDAHSTCPLCRYRVDPEDVLLVVDDRPPTPRRISGRHSSAGERGGCCSLEIIAENRGRISLDSLQKTGNRELSFDGWRKNRHGAENQGRRLRKDGQLPVQGEKHRLEHRIIISEGGGGEDRRWSDVANLYVRREMMMIGGSGRDVIKGRSVSEIVGVGRYGCNNGHEEGFGNRWLGSWISQSQWQYPAGHSDSASSTVV